MQALPTSSVLFPHLSNRVPLVLSTLLIYEIILLQALARAFDSASLCYAHKFPVGHLVAAPFPNFLSEKDTSYRRERLARDRK